MMLLVWEAEINSWSIGITIEWQGYLRLIVLGTTICWQSPSYIILALVSWVARYGFLFILLHHTCSRMDIRHETRAATFFSGDPKKKWKPVGVFAQKVQIPQSASVDWKVLLLLLKCTSSIQLLIGWKMIEHCQTRSKSAKLLIESWSKPSNWLAMQGARKVQLLHA